MKDAERGRRRGVPAMTLVLAVLLSLLSAAPASAGDPRVPRDSGRGKRVVYDRSAQRVWLVRKDESVHATYLVSGHKYGTLPAVGRYRVKSRSRYTQSLDGSVRMQYMVRFVYGNTRWIGFHSIPVNSAGNLIQPLSKLGTPTSSGCIRQRLSDARLLWRHAPVDTRVVVVP